MQTRRKRPVSIFEIHVLNIKSRDPHSLNETFHYHIPNTSIYLYLTDHGDRLPFDDVTSCLNDAGVYIVRQITLRGDGPMHAKTYRRNNVALNIVPQAAMTLMIAGEVIDALEEIVSVLDWTYATHIAVVDAILGMLGYLDVSYRSPGLTSTSQIGGSLQAVETVNGSTSPTVDSQQNNSLTTRPPSPYIYVIPGSAISIVFQNYGGTLRKFSILATLLKAQFSVIRQCVEVGLGAPVGEVEAWQRGAVDLEVTPSDGLSWSGLSVALLGLVDFMSMSGGFAFDFEIMFRGTRSLGTGQLRPKS